MERAEFRDGRNESWSSWKGDPPDWVQDRKINVLMPSDSEGSPICRMCRYSDETSQNNPEERAVPQLISYSGFNGSPIDSPTQSICG